MTRAEVAQLVQDHPDRGELPVACVVAICKVESDFNEWAYRYEPGFKYLVGDVGTMSPTEKTEQMASWGLMQVMGGVAREMGFKGFCSQLCQPYTGLSYGMRHLAKFYKKYQDWPDAIASYNAGSPRKNQAGQYFNQGYVDKVLKAWADLEVPIPIKETEV